MRNSKD